MAKTICPFIKYGDFKQNKALRQRTAVALKILVCHTLVNIDFANLNLFLVLISKFSFCSIIVWLFERDVYV